MYSTQRPYKCYSNRKHDSLAYLIFTKTERDKCLSSYISKKKNNNTLIREAVMFILNSMNVKEKQKHHLIFYLSFQRVYNVELDWQSSVQLRLQVAISLAQYFSAILYTL